ncbi:MAG TPA: hypothetical protein VFQ79_14515 [Bryobacteraceae bacterium]|nr:hypothetical protein [Bryobacteraceae bacterium]
MMGALKEALPSGRKVLNRAATNDNRSQFISEAIMYDVNSKAKNTLTERLKEGAITNAQRDLEIAREWFSLDEEAWKPATPTRKRTK